jgi:hypothetical protein
LPAMGRKAAPKRLTDWHQAKPAPSLPVDYFSTKARSIR